MLLAQSVIWGPTKAWGESLHPLRKCRPVLWSCVKGQSESIGRTQHLITSPHKFGFHVKDRKGRLCLLHPRTHVIKSPRCNFFVRLFELCLAIAQCGHGGWGFGFFFDFVFSRPHERTPLRKFIKPTPTGPRRNFVQGRRNLSNPIKEIASWRLDHAGSWHEQKEPPLAIFYMEAKIGRRPAELRSIRLRLILVHASEVRGAENWLGSLTQRDTYQPYPWMPRQNTESMLLWAYAADGDSRPYLWLGPKSTDDASTMVLRHWLMNKMVPTFPLPGIFFFDAWRIRPSLTIPPQLSVGLTAVDLTHDEEMPQEPEAQDTTHVDRLLQRQDVLTARADAKTAADCAVEVSYVMQLTAALLEAEDIIAESTTARHHYLDVQREHEETLEQQ